MELPDRNCYKFLRAAHRNEDLSSCNEICAYLCSFLTKPAPPEVVHLQATAEVYSNISVCIFIIYRANVALIIHVKVF